MIIYAVIGLELFNNKLNSTCYVRHSNYPEQSSNFAGVAANGGDGASNSDSGAQNSMSNGNYAYDSYTNFDFSSEPDYDAMINMMNQQLGSEIGSRKWVQCVGKVWKY